MKRFAFLITITSFLAVGLLTSGAYGGDDVCASRSRTARVSPCGCDNPQPVGPLLSDWIARQKQKKEQTLDAPAVTGTPAASAPMPRGSGFSANRYKILRYPAAKSDQTTGEKDVFRIGF